jgi:hypothetical protein
MTKQQATFDTECFFIAPIGAEASDARHRSDGVMNFIVARAAEELGLATVRADQISEPGLITRQVIDHLLNAKAAVADLTGLNANVFYELAVRHTARLPTVLIAEEGEHLPFDIAQMRTIFFRHQDLASADQCRGKIVAQLGEALKGAVESPISTSLDLKSLEAGDATERNIAEIVTAVGDVQARIRQLLLVVTELSTTSERDQQPHPRAMADLEEATDKLEVFARSQRDSDLVQLIEELRPPVEYLVNRFGHRSRRFRRPTSRRSDTSNENEAALELEGET